MADTELRVERYVDGVLVDTQTFARPTVDVNRDVLRERAAAALTANADFLALASPTNAQAVQQLKALTRQVNAVIRLLVLDALDDIADA